MVEPRPVPMDDLEAALTDLAHHIEHPPAVELAPVVMARLATVERAPRSHWRPHDRAGVLAAVVLTLPAPRHALADWLGIGAVRVVRTEQVPDGTGSGLRLGHEVSLPRGSQPRVVHDPRSVEPRDAVGHLRRRAIL